MASRMQNKVVLVTGASKGIGRALASGFAREGADVIVHYHRDRAGAEATAEQVAALGRRSLIVGADLANTAEIDGAFAQIRGSFERLDVLVNNAAFTGWSSLWDVTDAKWDQVMNTNLKGTFFCSLAAAKWMRSTGVAGSIVNVSSNCAALGVPNLIVYATSKCGLHGLTRQLAIELAPDRIRVNAFAPGPTNVERNLRDDPQYAAAWGRVVPLGRTAAPEEMVGTALYLASEESSYVTGQVFYVDGGWSVQGLIPRENLDVALRKRSEPEGGTD